VIIPSNLIKPSDRARYAFVNTQGSLDVKWLAAVLANLPIPQTVAGFFDNTHLVSIEPQTLTGVRLFLSTTKSRQDFTNGIVRFGRDIIRSSSKDEPSNVDFFLKLADYIPSSGIRTIVKEILASPELADLIGPSLGVIRGYIVGIGFFPIDSEIDGAAALIIPAVNEADAISPTPGSTGSSGSLRFSGPSAASTLTTTTTGAKKGGRITKRNMGRKATRGRKATKGRKATRARRH
jgi:hypothetical protein